MRHRRWPPVALETQSLSPIALWVIAFSDWPSPSKIGQA